MFLFIVRCVAYAIYKRPSNCASTVYYYDSIHCVYSKTGALSRKRSLFICMDATKYIFSSRQNSGESNPYYLEAEPNTGLTLSNENPTWLVKPRFDYLVNVACLLAGFHLPTPPTNIWKESFIIYSFACLLTKHRHSVQINQTQYLGHRFILVG